MAGERKVFNSKRKQGSISFDLDTDDGLVSYYVMKMTCAQTSDWTDFVKQNTEEVVGEDGKKMIQAKTTKNWKETLLSLSVVDSQYRPLAIEHFNEWTPEAVDDAYKLAEKHNFPDAEVEKKES